jgi:histidine ammonia-lyase
MLQTMVVLSVIPVVPGQGSVGASGDLAPLAHMTEVMIGVGHAYTPTGRLPAIEALASVGLKAVVLGHAADLLETEANGVSDIPLIFPGADGRDDEALSGGNFHAPLVSSAALQQTLHLLRTRVAHLDNDRPIQPDMQAAIAMVRRGALIASNTSVALPGIA